ncbi:MAG: hypothetical protein U5K79_04495 [Cyclobacteriaceae bacterium]|nr:hypothetical protein [Cyclobacteriaceae bacterium]
MLIPFQSLSPNSRIWIYQSSRVFTPEEQNMLKTETEAFLTEWTAHGQSLRAGMQIAFDRFLIIGVNEDANEASGCSIDKSVAFVKQMEKRFNTDFLDRTKIAYRLDGQVLTMDFKEFKNSLGKNEISEKAEVFNNTVQIKMELDNAWIQPVASSRLGKHLVNK